MTTTAISDPPGVSIKMKFDRLVEAGSTPGEALRTTAAWLKCNSPITPPLPPDWRAELKNGGLALFGGGRELDPAQYDVPDVWQPGTQISTEDELLEAMLDRLQAKPERLGRTRGFKKDWVQLAVEAAALHREFPEATPTAIAKELERMLVAEGQEQPAESKLRELVEDVFRFDENRLMRLPRKSSGLRLAKPKKGN